MGSVWLTFFILTQLTQPLHNYSQIPNMVLIKKYTHDNIRTIDISVLPESVLLSFEEFHLVQRTTSSITRSTLSYLSYALSPCIPGDVSLCGTMVQSGHWSYLYCNSI